MIGTGPVRGIAIAGFLAVALHPAQAGSFGGAAGLLPDSSDFMPHGYCYLWNPFILWLHVASDSLITLSYYFIPIVLIYFIRKNPRIPFDRIFSMFGVFILACGTTHLMEVWNIWHSNYLLAGILKGITAAVSVVTAAMLIPLVPRVMSLPQLFHLQQQNRELERQIAEHKRFDAPIDVSLRRRVTAGFMFAVFITFLIGFTSWYGARRAEQDAYWVAHTYVEMDSIEDASKDLIEAETSARAFALSGEESLLAHYQRSRQGVQQDEEMLRRLTADNPSQQRRLDVLKPQILAALSFADHIIAKRRSLGAYSGGIDALEIEAHLIAVRASTQAMRSEEERLLAQRLQTAAATQRLTRVIAGLGFLLGAGLWLMAKFAVSREIHVNERVRTQLRAINFELRMQIKEREAAEEKVKSTLSDRERTLASLAEQTSAVEELQLAQAALRESEERFNSILQSAMDAIITVDERQVIQMFNAAAEKMFGCEAREAIGKSVECFIPERFRGNHAQHIRRFGETGATTRTMGTLGAVWGKRANGQEFPVEASISQIGRGNKRLLTVILRDISERQRSEARNLRLAAIVDSSTEAILSKSLDGTILSWNRGAELLLGYSEAETVGKNVRMIVPDARLEQEENILKEIALGNQVTRYETMRRRKDSSEVSVSLNVSPIRDRGGEIIGASSIAHDITEIKDAERRLSAQGAELAISRETLEEQARMLELAPVMIRDLRGRITLWTRGAEQLYGFGSDQALGAISHELLQTVFPGPLEQLEKQLLEVGRWEGELVHRKGNGQIIHVASIWVLHRNQQGEPVQILEVNTDITARKEAEERLAMQAEELSRQAEDLLRSRETLAEQGRVLKLVLESMGEGLVAVDENGKFIIWNPAAEKIVGMGATDVHPEQWSSYYGVFLPDTVTPFPTEKNPLVRAIQGEASNEEMYLRNPRSSAGIFIEANAQPLKDKSGNLRGGVIAFRDITQRKMFEQEIRTLNQNLEIRVAERTAELQAANKELEAFTYSVSHDLRAPLRHMSGFTRILVEDFGSSLPPDALQHLQRIEGGAQRMGQLVDELLQLTRVGRQSLNLQETQLNPIVQEIIGMMEPETKGRQVEWRIGEMPVVECDATLMRQVFQNLIGNALKYSRPRSPAVIEIGQIEKDGEDVIFLKDNGVGFSMKYADKLFGVFQRLHRAEEFEGTGVGLATVQRIIQKHGGRVWAESEVGQGSTFYFSVARAAHRFAGEAAAVAGDHL